jgi:plasmid stabilization system protein ParE
MKRVEWTDSAIADLQGIRIYLSQFGDERAQDGLRKLILSARWLTDYPYAGPLVGVRKWRKWKPRGQNYILIYQPREGGISIIRVRDERNDWRAEP